MYNKLPTKFAGDSFGAFVRRASVAVALTGLAATALKLNYKLRGEKKSDFNALNAESWVALGEDGKKTDEKYNGAYLESVQEGLVATNTWPVPVESTEEVEETA